ncbi:hypothetical protein MRB53_030091 [Persea americana]|uniref:Uncharacterized protein n=1 Tax=Persea americana TaxID=3435 RepID=A0ACC2KKL0_PERAE|nr:hypothetical protein MRB53_030091 [Persea americana]
MLIRTSYGTFTGISKAVVPLAVIDPGSGILKVTESVLMCFRERSLRSASGFFTWATLSATEFFALLSS